jgi:GH25 family lysozyme M1 (1,4-beta-N-acetylmuramidase)
MEKLFGIDISHWQGDMSIEQARNERGVRFAIIKAAGADDGKYKDSKFENYYAQCKAIGLPVGAYYYGNAKSVTEAEQEADHFLSVIAGKQFEYPIYYDVEGKMLNNSRGVLTDIVIAFCDRCEKAGYFVGVYTSDSHFQAHVDDDRLQRFTHWVARYSSNEPVTVHDIWQYGGEHNYIADKTICGRTVDQDFSLS